jgi:hypothetical protein
MIEPASQTQRIHVPPGALYTGRREYACDGAVLELRVEGTRDQPRVTSCQIRELHDINVGQRRTRHDVGAFLRRCLRRIKRHGLIVVMDGQVLAVPADRISIDEIRFQQFCTQGQARGPFTSADEMI